MKFMNKIIISLAFFALSTTLSFAVNFTPYVKIDAGVEKKFNLRLENVTAETSIRILDQSGFTLVEETVKATEQFSKIFNLASLEAGEYQLVIKSELKETVQPIIVSRRGLLIEDAKRLEYFPALIQVRDHGFDVSLLNPTQSTITVFIKDQFGDLVFEDRVKDTKVIEKRYNVNQLPAGKYSVVINTGNATYTRTLDR